MKIKPETNVADIIASHERRVTRLEKLLLATLVLCLLQKLDNLEY